MKVGELANTRLWRVFTFRGVPRKIAKLEETFAYGCKCSSLPNLSSWHDSIPFIPNRFVLLLFNENRVRPTPKDKVIFAK